MTAEPRLLLMAKPPQKVLSAMVDVISILELGSILGAALFASENWHQSLSIRYPREPGYREKLLRAGSRISAAPFTMTFDQIMSRVGDTGRIHWEFRAHRRPKGFPGLQKAVQDALDSEGLDVGLRNTPHVTISYWAPKRLSRQTIDPIDWMIDEILLVEGGGEVPYRYRTIERWPLVTPPYPYAQLRLL